MNKEAACADNSIDILKFIFSIFIVGIHAKILTGDNFLSWFLLHWLFRVAVPFFFVASGYYLGKKLWNVTLENINVFRNYRKRLILPLMVWGGAGLITKLIQLFEHGTSMRSIVIFAIKTIVFYPRNAMWFLWACIIASYIIQLFWKHKKFKLLGIVALIGYAFALISNTYYFIIDGSYLADVVDKYIYYCVSARNGIFVGALFLFEGIILSSDRAFSFFKSYGKGKIWAAFMLSELFFIAEICFSYKKNIMDDSSLFIIFPILIPLIFVLALNYRMRIDIPYNKMRKISTSIYFSHNFILDLVKVFHFPCYVTFVIVITISIVIGNIVQKLDRPILNKIFV